MLVQYTIFFLCALLGMLFHCIMKLNVLTKQAKAGNICFTFKDYLQEDWLSILASFVSIFIWLLLFGEAERKYPLLINYARLSFVIFGASGSYIVQYFLSKAEKNITSVIDSKTNELDEIKKQETTINKN